MDLDEAILDRDHPSFGTAQATFQFAMEDVRTGALSRLVSVEAKNPYAVAAIERVLVKNDQRVSPNCRVLCVFRDCRSVGVRDDLVEEVPYVDFMTDIVEPGWLLSDAGIAACFSKSITPEEREHALAKARALDAAPSRPRLSAVRDEEPDDEEPEEAGTDQREQLVAALAGMGFKKAAVEKFVRGLGGRACREPMPDLLREGLRALAS